MDLTCFDTPAEFRAWLKQHGDSETELWQGCHKKSSGKTVISHAMWLDEALCFGWIDGLRRSIDADRYAQRWTPRTKRSNWSNINIKRFEELQAEGRVTPAGAAAFEARTSARSGVYSFEQDALELEPEQLAEFKMHPAAWAYWEEAPKSYRKSAIWWVISARKDETKSRRLEQLIECSANGERVPPLRPLPHKK